MLTTCHAPFQTVRAVNQQGLNRGHQTCLKAMWGWSKPEMIIASGFGVLVSFENTDVTGAEIDPKA